MKLFFIGLLLPALSWASFTHESEYSSLKIKGNNDFETYNAKTTNKFDQEKFNVTFGGHYTLGYAFENETVRNWDINAKLGKVMSSKIDLFIAEIFEGNEYIGIEDRSNLDIGFVYKFTKTDKEEFNSEISYRYTDEDPVMEGAPNNIDNKGRINLTYANEFNTNVWVKILLEYLPNFTTPKDYQVNFEPALQVTLTKIFSLKTSYIIRYDNQPALPHLKYSDEIYTTSLLARF